MSPATEKALTNPFEGQPHGWIQFKGTGLCMDVHCSCGEVLHVDGEFVYYIQCRPCGQYYALNGHVRLEPVERSEIDGAESTIYRLGEDEDEKDTAPYILVNGILRRE